MTINISLDQYNYYPAIRSRRAELEGLKELNKDRKRMILPVITLGEWPKAQNFEQSLSAASEAMDELPFIIDLTTDRARLPDLRQQLTGGADGFKAWRRFASQAPQAIPVVLINETARTRDVIRQAAEIEDATGKVAFRIRDFMTETPKVIAALCALNDPTNAVIFVDCQYIRNGVAAFATAAVATNNAIRAEFPESIISILSTSFPASTIPFLGDGQSGSIEILEQDLFSRAGGRGAAIYGDHASIHSVVYDDAAGGIRRWSPRIDYPTSRTWRLERRSGSSNAAGYISAAQTLLEQYPEIEGSDIWGEQKIYEAAIGNVHAMGPAKWIAVRVNIHLARQIDRTAGLEGDDGSEDEGSEEEDFDF
ncbi:MAG: beta family protein [Rhodanobacter sp.]|uniref:beta family protein n=1 Tax=Castellaniella sp. TaxID=1955812 RepID=UPI003C75A110